MWSKTLTLELDNPGSANLLTEGPWASDITALSRFSLYTKKGCHGD